MLSHLFLIIFTTLHVAAFPPRLLQSDGRPVSPKVFESLEELARIVDISYCVGTSGIQKPFRCLSRCAEFEGFELVTTWNTGPLLSDSCGYIALSHEPFAKRVIVAFRGTYSIANTIADLSTTPAGYTPFPSGTDDDSLCAQSEFEGTSSQDLSARHKRQTQDQQQPLDSMTLVHCANCTVHSGFLLSWHNTRCMIIPHVERAMARFPDYELVLVGHSLGGAVATLAALDFQARGLSPVVTTFGEPRLGNLEFNQFVDTRFNLNATTPDDAKFRRVTHVGDPVPLLPLQEWGYRMHAGEIFISKASLPPLRNDLRHCEGDEAPECIAGGQTQKTENRNNVLNELQLGIAPRFRLWELFFAHRDYFWRLGLCLPSVDPWHWDGWIYDDAEQDERTFSLRK